MNYEYWNKVIDKKPYKIVKFQDEYYKTERTMNDMNFDVLKSINNQPYDFLAKTGKCGIEINKGEIIEETEHPLKNDFRYTLYQAILSNSFYKEHQNGYSNDYLNYDYFSEDFKYAIAKRGSLIMLLEKKDYSEKDFDIDFKNKYFKDIYTVIKSNHGHSKKPDIYAGITLLVEKEELILTHFIKEVNLIKLSEENMIEVFDEIINLYNKIK